MKRSQSLKRYTPLSKGTSNRLLRSNPRYRRQEKQLPGAIGWTERVFVLYGRRCIVCRKKAVHGHHVVPLRTIKARGGDEVAALAYDARQGVPVCFECHEAHENASKRIPRSCLPAPVLEWAETNGFGWYVDNRKVYPDG